MLKLDYLEIDIISNCNLRCTHCSVGAPYLEAKTYDLDAFRRDLRALAQVAHIGKIRLLGGEPLLVRNLIDYVQSVKDSGLADAVGIVTNGLLLERADQKLIDALDYIDVSVYPVKPKVDAHTEKGVQRLVHLGKKMRVERIDTFFAADFDGRINDPKIVRRIWDECWQKTNCTSLYDGHVYLCTEGQRRGRYLKAIGFTGAAHIVDPTIDGCDVHAPDLERRLDAYLHRTNPLEACNYCLGCSGKRVPHRQLTLAEMKRKVPLPAKVSDLLRPRTDYLWESFRAYVSKRLRPYRTLARTLAREAISLRTRPAGSRTQQADRDARSAAVTDREARTQDGPPSSP